MSSPRVSVCIPAWCGGDFLEAAIRSVLAQTWTDFELLVIDDCSPDDTAERLTRYTADPRVKYIRNSKNLGPQGNWNRCLSEAQGAYIKILPHDDLIAPNCLEQQVKALDTHPQAVLAFASRSILGKGDTPLFTKRTPWKTGPVAARGALRKCIRSGTNVLGEPGAVLFRRSAAEKAGTFDSSIPYVLDLDYWARLLAYGDAWCDATPLASFRISNASWSVAIGRKQSSEFKAFISKVASQHHVRASALDIAMGQAWASMNNLIRRIIYSFVLR
ncbi:MAG: glycosyltransferase family 2 protein [Zoogloea sp.]|nr:glycosyltransferase family 2 protein [Zoogloea sp.]MCA0187265.1 glycosyltransferase [Pseudomonadota bacterium]